MWDVGYLKHWIFTDELPYPEEFWSGFRSSYGEIDDALAELFSVRPY